MPKKRKEKVEETETEYIKRKEKEEETATEYIDDSGAKIAVIRCGQCKGKGCVGCDNLGFLKQGTLL